MRCLVGAVLALTVPVSVAEAWHCRNRDLEIACDHARCAPSDGFTPLDVHLDDSGNLSVGMYSGVWEGRGRVFEEAGFLILVGGDLVFSTAPDARGDFLVAMDTRDRVALFKGAGYAMPMVCERSEMLESR